MRELISLAYYCDNLEYMRTIPDKFFELAIPDPQYGINATNMQMGSNPKRSKNDGYGSGPGISTAVKLKKGRLNQGSGKLKNRILNKADSDWDNEKPPKEYFEQLFRISQNQIIWGGNYFTSNLPESRCWICWDKMQPWDNFSQFELAWTSFDRPAALFRYSNTGGANAEKKIHETQKPVQLYRWVLSKFAKEGDKIFDSHMGSQSSRIAAYDMGFDYYGCEKSEFHFNNGCKRFEQFKSQLKLF